MRRTFLSPATGALIFVALAACSPTFNWREIKLGDEGMVAMLPCKPDRATREVGLAGGTASLSMVGCEAGGAMFTVARVQAPDEATGTAWLDAWKKTITARAAPGASPVEQAAVVARAAAAPAARRLEIQQAGADGSTVALQTLWFTQRSSGQTLTLYQASVLGRPGDAEAVAAFFAGLRLP
ncbi:MAG: hypothetical protein EOO24_05460 [Comamonadaceae bacterium]|nr:MAG: hypothetical protein EOO24_05460 [Comamonadaceae bacterium]